MGTNTHAGLLESDSNKEQQLTEQARNLLPQPHLRLVVSNDEEDFFDDRRKNAQSTSGRVSSTGTAPPLSRSNEMDRDSRMRSLVDKTLRKYPSEVPQRLANDSCSATVSRDFRYARSDSIPDSLPSGKILSIPDGHLPNGKGHYTRWVTKDELRAQNFLRLLRERYGDSPGDFEIATGYSANMVSQIKTGKKKIGERLAGKLEHLMKIEAGALLRALEDNGPFRRQPEPKSWPLSVPLADFESLSPRLQRELDEAFTRMVLGAQSEDLLMKQAKAKKRG
jgi:transcriptional regulator with XRE-family HTH domain